MHIKLEIKNIAYSKFISFRPPKVLGIDPVNLLKLRSLKKEQFQNKYYIREKNNGIETTTWKCLVPKIL